MALPNPASTWKLVRFLLRASEYAIPAGLAYLEGQLGGNHESVSDPHWVRAVVRCTRSTPAGINEDQAQFKFDFANITGGALDSSWTYADLSDVDAHLQTLLNQLQTYTYSACKFDEIRYYDMSFNPVGDLAKPFRDSGPPIGLTDVNIQGAGGNPLPYQIACSVTMRTAWPGHWGRVYLPNPSYNTGYIDSYGRWGSTYRGAIATMVEQMYADLAGHDFLGVVPVSSLNRAPFHALLGIDEIAVDDIPDVQRRRRPKHVAARSLGTHT